MEETYQQRIQRLESTVSKLLWACEFRGWDVNLLIDRGPHVDPVLGIVENSLGRIIKALHSGNPYDVVYAEDNLGLVEAIIFRDYPEDKIDEALLMVMS